MWIDTAGCLTPERPHHIYRNMTDLPHTQFLAEIDDFLEFSGLKPGFVAKSALGEAAAIYKFRSGTVPSFERAERLRAWMRRERRAIEAYRAAKGEE